MLNRNMWPIYRKWTLIALMLGCVYVFGYSDRMTQYVAAAPCYEECESNLNQCRDTCEGDCNDNGSSCGSCIISCQNQYWNCLGYAVSCENETVTPGHCSTEYGSHCPIINGVANCSDPGAYNAYFMICDFQGGTCVSCPYDRYCVGSNSEPWCGAFH
jgi:hypothetical protein